MDKLFALPEGIKAEDFPVITEQNKFAFCDLRGCELRPPFKAGKAVLLPLLLSSCVLNAVFEGVQDFSCDMGEDTARFTGYALRKKGGLYEYELTTDAGKARFLFRDARTEPCGILPAKDCIADKLAEARAQAYSLPETELKRKKLRLPKDPGEYFPSMEELCLPCLAEKEELGILSEADAPFFALWQLYLALFDEISEPDEKDGFRISVGGFAACFEKESFDLAPVLKKHAPALAADYAAAKDAFGKQDAAALSALAVRYTAGRFRPSGSGAAMAKKHMLDRAAHETSLRYRGAFRRQAAQKALFVRALCAMARER